MGRPVDPGARKWRVLERLATSPDGLTVRELAELHGFAGGERSGVNGSPWKNAMNKAARTMRILEGRGWAERAGKHLDGFAQGNPAIWVITPAGVARIAEFGGDRAALPRRVPAVRREAAQIREVMAIPAGARDGLGRDLRPPERRAVVRQIRPAGVGLRPIAVAAGVSGTQVRLDLLTAGQRRRLSREASRAKRAREKAEAARVVPAAVTCDWPGCGHQAAVASPALAMELMTPAKMRAALRRQGWATVKGGDGENRDFCPEHSTRRARKG